MKYNINFNSWPADDYVLVEKGDMNIPDELVKRYNQNQDEYLEIQKELTKIVRDNHKQITGRIDS